jgi:hypothetical protein
MMAHRLVLLILVTCVVAAASAAVADEKPLETKAQKAAPGAEDQRMFLAQCQEDDRRYKRLVQADPHDIRAWQLLGWNEAYNLSVTTDDSKERYTHVRQGIEHLVQGVTQNPTNATLYWHVGFYLTNRIGQSESREAFRKLFRNDKEFHELLARHVNLKAVEGPDGLPDNHLVALRWFEKTIAIVDKHGSPEELQTVVTPLVLNCYPAICQKAYASSVEDDGHFGEAATNAWKQALKMWELAGEHEFVAMDGTKYRLKNNEFARKLVNYDYWKQRSQVEQTEPLLTARRATYRAKEYLREFKGKNSVEFTDQARSRAKLLFDEAFRAWDRVFKEHPWLVENEDGLVNAIGQYQRRILNGKPLPGDFPLRRFPDLLPPGS